LQKFGQLETAEFPKSGGIEPRLYGYENSIMGNFCPNFYKISGVNLMLLPILFWTSVFLICYTYILYPIGLFIMATALQIKRDIRYLLAKNERRRRDIKEDELPTVSIVVAAYNEEKVIEAKIHNMLALDYPRDKYEIIIGSDGSTDRTNEIVSAYQDRGIQLINYTDRGGKTNVLNRTIPRATGEIVVLSDANTMYAKDSLRKIVRYFRDPAVGCVCGELRFVSPEGKQESETAYWKYEVLLKFLESKLGTVLGANGAIYALRKELFEPIPSDTVIDDFLIGMNVKKKGYKVYYDAEAVAYEETANDVKAEFARRKRIGAGNFHALTKTLSLLNPLKGFVALAYLSHKVIRWFVPFFMLFAMGANIAILTKTAFLKGNHIWMLLLYGGTLAVQLLFYLLALGGHLTRNRESSKLLRLPHYFLSMNIALFLGFFRFITKTQKVAWKRTERTAPLLTTSIVDKSNEANQITDSSAA